MCGPDCEDYILFSSPQKQTFIRYAEEEAAKPPKPGSKAALTIAQLQAEVASLRRTAVPVTDSQATAVVTDAVPMEVDQPEPPVSNSKQAGAGKGKGKGSSNKNKSKQVPKGSVTTVTEVRLVDNGSGSGPHSIPSQPRYQSSPRSVGDAVPISRAAETDRTPQYGIASDRIDVSDITAGTSRDDEYPGTDTSTTVDGTVDAEVGDGGEPPHLMPAPAQPTTSGQRETGSGYTEQANSHDKLSRSQRRKRQRERSQSKAGAKTIRVEPRSEDSPVLLGTGTAIALPEENVSTAKPLFDVIERLLPGVVRSSDPQRHQVRSYVDRILNTNVPPSVPFKTLPLSPEVAGNMATVWHGVMDTRLRPVTTKPRQTRTEAILCHVGGTDASLLRGAIPKTPKVGNKVYALYPKGTLEAAPVLPVSITRPREVKIPQATNASLSEDWRMALRQVSFVDTITGAIARVAADTENSDLLTLTSAIGSAIGDLSSTISHGFATQLLLTRDSVLDSNHGSTHLREDAARARVGPPLSNDLLPRAVASEKEVRRTKDTKLKHDLFTAMQRKVLTSASTAKQPQASNSNAKGKPSGEPTTSGRGRGGRGRGSAPREARGRGNAHRGARGGANHPTRGRGAAAKGTN